MRFIGASRSENITIVHPVIFYHCAPCVVQRLTSEERLELICVECGWIILVCNFIVGRKKTDHSKVIDFRPFVVEFFEFAADASCQYDQES